MGKPNNLLANSKFDLIIRKYTKPDASGYFRSLCFLYKNTRVIYRYPFKCDSEEFIQKLAKFIESELINNKLTLNPYKSTFFIGVEDGNLIHVEKNTFDEIEKKQNKDPVIFY